MTREITIEPVLNGFVLRVGCQRIAFQSTDIMLDQLAKYYADPEGTEKWYIENAVNKSSPIAPTAPILHRREVTSKPTGDPSPALPCGHTDDMPPQTSAGM